MALICDLGEKLSGLCVKPDLQRKARPGSRRGRGEERSKLILLIGFLSCRFVLFRGSGFPKP
jgi:hypothetical protein